MQLAHVALPGWRSSGTSGAQRAAIDLSDPRLELVDQPHHDEVHILPRTALLDEVAGEEVGIGSAQRGVPTQVPVNADARLIPDDAGPTSRPPLRRPEGPSMHGLKNLTWGVA